MAATKSSTTFRKTAPKRNRRAPTIKQQRAKFDRTNRDWAEGVLRSPERHPPYMVTTARSVLKRLEEAKCQDGQTSLPLNTIES